MKKIPFLVLVVSLFLFSKVADAQFITTWKTDNLGGSSSADNEILIPINPLYSYNYSVYWEDINNTAINGTLLNVLAGLHLIFPAPGTYRVYITGTFPAIRFNGWDLQKLLSVDQWGNNHWLSMNRAFYRCANLVINASDAPDLSGVTDMSEMFREASAVNQDINHWNVSTVTNMQGMFRRAISYNQPLNNWDVSAVTNMQYMFSFATAFNQNIDGWDVSHVTDMSNMFSFGTAFNQPLNNWDVSAVTTMASMFYLGDVFNQPLNNWDVSSVIDMSQMFMASDFNQDISGWNVSLVTNMRAMFANGTTFNQDISSWDVSNVTDMSDMFMYAIDFNIDIGSWNVGNVTNMSRMLQRCYAFNQDIRNWDVSSVTNMSGMFVFAYTFNQNISGWDVNAVTNMANMFEDAGGFNQNLASWNVQNVTDMTNIFSNANAWPGISNENYDQTLIGWAALPSLQANVPIGAPGKRFCAAENARNTLISTYGWTFTGDFRFCPAPVITSFTPTSGVTGTEITITGTNFTGATQVYVGSTPSASYTVVDATTITAIVGNGSSGALSVWTPDGGDFSDDSFTFYDVPTLDSFTPTSAESGVTVTITGTNFTDATSVIFGGVAATSFTVIDATAITAVVGAGATGTIVVTTPGGTATSGSTFTFIPANTQPPLITTTPITTRIEGIVILNLVPLITSASTLDLSSLKIIEPPASGASATIDANGMLTINYAGIMFSGTEHITIEACDVNSNCASESFNIEVAGDLIVYNGISPGGMNPELIIEHINVLLDTKENTVTIFDRWQNQVWSGKNYDNTSVVFRGESDAGNELPSGVYFYRIDFNSSRKRQSGFISIKR